MASARKERIARNEAMFREGNERMRAWPEREEAPATDKLLFLCECADPKCREHVSLTRPEYEAVRADPTHFAVVDGHEIPDAERVVERHEGHVVIEKNEEVHGIAEDTDPRTES
jgi:hypothetical protein